MSLADVPKNTQCRICSVFWVEENMKYVKAGIHRGNELRVICRHPAAEPRFVEVELENKLLITLPLAFAKEVTVETAVSM